MYQANQILNWFQHYNEKQRETDPNVEPLTVAKGLKLLYLAQAFCYGFTVNPLFDEDIVVTKYGPLISSIMKEYNQTDLIRTTPQTSKDYELVSENEAAVKLLVSLYESSCLMTAKELFDNIKEDKPWQDTKPSMVINPWAMAVFYGSMILLGDEDD